MARNFTAALVTMNVGIKHEWQTSNKFKWEVVGMKFLTS